MDVFYSSDQFEGSSKDQLESYQIIVQFCNTHVLQILEILRKGYCFTDHALLPEKQFCPQKSGNLIQTSFFTPLSFLLENLKVKRTVEGENNITFLFHSCMYIHCSKSSPFFQVQ